MSSRSSSLFLGIDGGGSKTLAVIVDSTGRERGRGVAGSSNHEAVGLDTAIASIYAAVGQATMAAQAELPLAVAWLGLAGVDHPQNVETLLPHVRSLATTVHLTNDAELVLSALPHQVGVALIAGTGSIAMGRSEQGKHARVGGWGHVLGDEGSGYTIGRLALQYAVRAADERGPSTALLDAILTRWELATPEMILARVYPSDDKTAIAALAPLVLSVARAGDPVARRIETRAARELALAATTVARILEFSPGVLPLAYSGGVLTHEKRLRDLVTHHIERAWSVAPVVVEEPASSAARALAERSAP